MTSHADRTRRCRDRQKHGKIQLTVELDETEIVEALVQAGWLNALQADDPKSIAEAFAACSIAVLPKSGHAA